MNTLHLHTTEDDIRTAAQLLQQGRAVGIPTETVYGLAADARDPAAVASIFEAKGRPQDNPLIVHIASMEQLAPLVQEIPPLARKLAKAFWPGPLTMIFRRADTLPASVSAGLPTVAIRMPSHPVARKLILRSGCPLAAPSANTSGRPSPTTAGHVLDDLGGRIAAVVDAGPCSVGVESTVIDVTTQPVRLYRPGAVTVEMLETVAGPVEVSHAVTENLAPGEKALSPGMKYKHYAPRAAVGIITGTPRAYVDFVNRHAGPGVTALCFEQDAPRLRVPTVCYGSRGNDLSQAQELFDALRELDRIDARTVYAACPHTAGVGLAVYNRLLRAAGFAVRTLPFVIGLTGPTGAGKGEVARRLAEQGCRHVDTDRLAHQATEPGSPCLQELAQAFSPQILRPDGSLDRAGLAERAFRTEEGRRTLNAIVHPYVTEQVQNILEQATEPFVVIDAPLLFEAQMHRICDVTVAVLADASERRRRIRERDHLAEEAAALRMQAQPDDEFYLQRADVVLRNDDTLDTLFARTDALLWKWQQEEEDE